jgi:hypothetical protein
MISIEQTYETSSLDLQGPEGSKDEVSGTLNSKLSINSEKNIWTESLEILKEKKNQELIYLNKVNPVNRQILKRLITEFDLSNSWVKILKKYNFESSKNVIEELKKSFLMREVFLNQKVTLINQVEEM